jgi:hypothetical protein
MRKTIIVVVLLVVAWVALSAWPFIALYDFLRAAEAGDVAKIEQQVDFPALRRSLAGQVMQTYARLSGMRTDRGGLMVGVASAFADPFIEKLVSPAALAELLRSGWPKALLAEPPAGVPSLDWSAVGNIWQLYANSDYGLGEFRLSVPAGQPPEKQFRIQLAFADWTWKLSGLDLPQEVQERLARELMKQQGKPPG